MASASCPVRELAIRELSSNRSHPQFALADRELPARLFADYQNQLGRHNAYLGSDSIAVGWGQMLVRSVCRAKCTNICPLVVKIGSGILFTLSYFFYAFYFNNNFLLH